MRTLSTLSAALITTFAIPGIAQEAPLPADLRLYPAGAEAKPRPWAIFFPRAMGIGALAPGNQYADLAAFLNERGIDVLLVDDDAALKRLKPPGSTGEKRAAIALDALAKLRANGRFDMRCPGVAVGWSRGGEGALTLAANRSGPDSGFRAAIVYYPSVGGQASPWPQTMAVLALQGAGDSVAPAAKLAALAAGRVKHDEHPFTIKLYPGAKHRFDVRYATDDPANGKQEKDFDAAAHADGLSAIDAFLKERGISGASCALD